MKSRLKIFILTVLVCFQTAFATLKILVVVEHNCLGSITSYVNDYCDAIVNTEAKHVQLIDWTNPSGSMMDQAQALRSRLAQEYQTAYNAGDIVEGAVLIGDVCVPEEATDNGGGNFSFLPMDHFLMDIINTNVSPTAAYTSRSTPFDTTRVFYTGYFTGNYNGGGDNKYDIWISRIDAGFLPALREGFYIKDEYEIYTDYLQKVVNRMNDPATVPSRGFIMGGPENRVDIDYTLGCLRNLKLPWFTEFDGVEQNSPFNWMSQLLAGPRGAITYGSYNGSLFPTNDRNRRYSRYNLLNVFINGSSTSTPVSIANNDSSGWEWAGLYNHSSPDRSNFFSNEGDGNDFVFNGRFGNANKGPFVGNYKCFSSSAVNGEYLCYDGPPLSEKNAYWRWPVTADGTYDVYMSYVLLPQNIPHVYTGIIETNVNVDNVPNSTAAAQINSEMDQTLDRNDLPQYPGMHWQKVFPGVTLHQGKIAIVSMTFDYLGTNQYTTRVADAVRFIRTDGVVNVPIDDAEPSAYTEQDNNPYYIFSTRGFVLDDYYCRYYEDLGNEQGGGGFSKSQFFMFNACDINDFIESKNIGTMYALGHNGLISMGCAYYDYSGLLFNGTYYPCTNDGIRAQFVAGLRIGMDFGQAFIYALNQSFPTLSDEGFHSLLGAGSLRAQPYIQYGSYKVEFQNITSGLNTTVNNPILIRDVNVNGNGSWNVQSLTPSFGNSEVVIRPETDLAPTGTNTVDIVAR